MLLRAIRAKCEARGSKARIIGKGSFVFRQVKAGQNLLLKLRRPQMLIEIDLESLRHRVENNPAARPIVRPKAIKVVQCVIGRLMPREGIPACDVILVANDALAIGLPQLNENTIIHNRRRFAWLLNEPEASHRD